MFESIICIIQARQGSSRLPGKVMMKLNGKPVIERVVNRVKAVNVLARGPLIDEIWVATTTNKKDDVIWRWCLKNKVKCYRGSETDVLERFYNCWVQKRADLILRVTADCPFIEPVLIYGLINKALKTGAGYQALAVNRGGIIDGHDAEIFTAKALMNAYKNAITDKQKEHVSLIMRSKTQDELDYGLPFDFRDIKLSLDTRTDYELLKEYGRYL